MHYLHRYLVKIEDTNGDLEALKEEAVSAVEDCLEPYKESLYDYYVIGDGSRWSDEYPPCVSAAEVGPEKFFRLIDTALASRQKWVADLLAAVKKAYPGGIPHEALVVKEGHDPMAQWQMAQLLQLVPLGKLLPETFFYNFVDYDTDLSPDRKADIREDPEAYFLVFADLHC